MIIIHISSVILPLGRTTLFFIRIQIIILFIFLLTNSGSCDKDPICPVLSIHDFSDCVTGIFSIVTLHDFIRHFDIFDNSTNQIPPALSILNIL